MDRASLESFLTVNDQPCLKLRHLGTQLTANVAVNHKSAASLTAAAWPCNLYLVESNLL